MAATTYTLTTDGSTDLGKLQPRRGNDINTRYFISLQGTFDGATIALQFSKDGGTTKTDVDTTNLSFGSSGQYGFHVVPGDQYFLTVSSAGASTSVLATVARCDGE